MSYSGSYFDWDTRTTNKNVLALWIVVVLVVLYLAGYLAYVLSKTSGMDDPRTNGLFPSVAFAERTDGRWVSGFTGGYNAQSLNFT